MKVTTKGFLYHKNGETPFDCADRYGVNTKTGRFAISDGVTQSFFPGIWAEELVKAFINDNHFGLAHVVEWAQSEWLKRVKEIVDKPGQKWFVRNAYLTGKGAAATLVGLHFFSDNGVFKWEGLAVGDSFLFYITDAVPNNRIATSLPKAEGFEFNNYPDCIKSNTDNKAMPRSIKWECGLLKPGTFYLMTDAMAEWFITPTTAVEIIAGWHTQNDFEKSIISLRKRELLRDDDAAILIIRVEEDNLPGIHYTQSDDDIVEAITAKF